MKKLLDQLKKSQKLIYSADHLIYTTYPVIKDKRILLEVLKELNKTLIGCITTILQYEYIFKRIKLSKDPKENMKTFENKCAKRYQITENEIIKIKEILNLTKLHKNSPMTFRRKEKIIILKDSLEHEELNIEKIKEFLFLSKEIFKKTIQNMILK